MLPPLTDLIEMLIQCKMVPFSTEFTKMFRDLDGGSKPPPYNIFNKINNHFQHTEY